MIVDIQKQVNAYAEWIKSKTLLRAIDDVVEVTTPFIDRHNDYIQLYIKKNNDEYYLTDEGYTLSDLAISGVDILRSESRKKLLQITLNGLGIKRTDEELYVNASERDFPQKKHQLIQAILAVNDMFYLSRSYVKSLFFEDVLTWFQANNIRGTRNISLPGKSGFYHSIDYSIPSSSKFNDRFIKIISKPDKNVINASLFAYSDIMGTRGDFVPYVILNDEDKTIKTDFIEAFRNYEIKAIPWSRRDKFIEDLAA